MDTLSKANQKANSKAKATQLAQDAEFLAKKLSFIDLNFIKKAYSARLLLFAEWTQIPS
jgi:hypothetical protein